MFHFSLNWFDFPEVREQNVLYTVCTNIPCTSKIINFLKRRGGDDTPFIQNQSDKKPDLKMNDERHVYNIVTANAGMIFTPLKPV